MTMRALTVLPGEAGSTRLEEVPEPDLRDGSVLVLTLAVGVCGTDIEIVRGGYGWAPPGRIVSFLATNPSDVFWTLRGAVVWNQATSLLASYAVPIPSPARIVR